MSYVATSYFVVFVTIAIRAVPDDVLRGSDRVTDV